jgi:zinc transporter ZupT
MDKYEETTVHEGKIKETRNALFRPPRLPPSSPSPTSQHSCTMSTGEPFAGGTAVVPNDLLYEKLVVGFTCLIVSLLFGLLPSYLSNKNTKGVVCRTKLQDSESSAVDIISSRLDNDETNGGAATATSEGSSRCGTCGNNTDHDGESDCVVSGRCNTNTTNNHYGSMNGEDNTIGGVCEGENIISTDGEDDPTMLPRWLSLATSFGGGVFLGAAFLHLLPEASDILDGQFPSISSLLSGTSDGTHDFPRANLLCCLGFLLVLGLEEWMPSESVGKSNKSSSIALVAALSCHSLFDGLAIGAVTTITQLNAVSIAILAHKPISSFALGSILLGKRLSAGDEVIDEDATNDYEPLARKEESATLPTQRRQSCESASFETLNGQADNLFGKRRESDVPRRISAHYYFKYAHNDCDLTCNKDECMCNDWDKNQCGDAGTRTSSSLTAGSYQAQQVDPSAIKTRTTARRSWLHRIRSIPVSTFLYITSFALSGLVGTMIGAVGFAMLQHTEVESVSSVSSPYPSVGSIFAATFQSLAAGTFLYAATMEALKKESSNHHRHHYHHHHDDSQHQTIRQTNRVVAASFGVLAMAAIKMLEAE